MNELTVFLSVLCYSHLSSLLNLGDFMRDISCQEDLWSSVPEAQLLRYATSPLKVLHQTEEQRETTDVKGEMCSPFLSTDNVLTSWSAVSQQTMVWKTAASVPLKGHSLPIPPNTGQSTESESASWMFRFFAQPYDCLHSVCQLLRWFLCFQNAPKLLTLLLNQIHDRDTPHWPAEERSSPGPNLHLPSRRPPHFPKGTCHSLWQVQLCIHF